jgi:hypothetical protein
MSGISKTLAWQLIPATRGTATAGSWVPSLEREPSASDPRGNSLNLIGSGVLSHDSGPNAKRPTDGRERMLGRRHDTHGGALPFAHSLPQSVKGTETESGTELSYDTS